MQALHHFVMSCTPLDDGTVEIVCQQQESVMMFVPERKVKIFNHSRCFHRGGYAYALMTGMPAFTPQQTVSHSGFDSAKITETALQEFIVHCKNLRRRMGAKATRPNFSEMPCLY